LEKNLECQWLTKQICHFRMQINITDTKQLNSIINKASEVFHLPLYSLLSKSRKQDLNLARICICQIASEKHKIHHKVIAEALNRDRTCVYHWLKMHQNLYGNWAKYRDKFNLLYENIYSDQKSAPILGKPEIRKILLKNKMVAKNGRVTIVITSGSTTYNFRTIYADMCENVEKIKAIFEGYEIKIDIQL